MKKQRLPQTGGRIHASAANPAISQNADDNADDNGDFGPPIPSTSGKSASTKSILQVPILAQGESSSSSGVSVTFEDEDVTYVPTGGKVEIGYTVFPDGVTVSAEISRDTPGSGDATFEDGSTSQEIKDTGTLKIIGVAPSSTVNNIKISAPGAERKLTVITYQLQAEQTIGGDKKWRPEQQGESINNLLAVWADEEITLRLLFEPEEFGVNLTDNFVVWEIQGEEIPPNTLEHTFIFSEPGIRYKIILKFKKLKEEKWIYVDVPDIGTIGQDAAAAVIWLSLGGSRRIHLIDLYRGWATDWALPMEEPRRDALRHAFGMALCASDPAVGAENGLYIGKAHEVTNKQEAFLSTMDLHNNLIGSQTVYTTDGIRPPILTVVKIPDVPKIQQELLRKYDEGKLFIWDGDPTTPNNGDGQVIKSDGTKIYQSSAPITE